MENTVFQITVICAAFAVMSLPTISADQQNATIYCYQCNSAKDLDGKACESELQKDLAPFSQVCMSDEEHQYTRCRKMVQTVEAETRIIRSCATAGTGDADRCVDRVGTVRVKAQYCECHNESPDTPCNSAHPLASLPAALTFALLLVSGLLSRL